MSGGRGRLRDVAVLGLAELVDRNVADRLAEMNGARAITETFHHRRFCAGTGSLCVALPGVSADWQIVLPDGTALGDIRYTLQTDNGALLYVQSRGVRHGSPEVLERLGRGEDVDASEYTFRTSTQIETAS